LLALQVIDIALPFRICHSFVTTLCILRQPIIILPALTICHISIPTLFVPAEPFEFEVYRRVRSKGARVIWVEVTIAIVATDAGASTPIRRFEPRCDNPANIALQPADYCAAPDPPDAERHLG
jgi:hypothetical protein